MTTYFNKNEVEAKVRAGEHREIIGGLWNEMGRLQLDFLKSQGLEPQHRLLDIGCGSLRGGVRFVDFLEPGNYFGTDINGSLLEAGYGEIIKARLTAKLPRSNLIEDGAFDFSWVASPFDCALAQSVFTHLSLPYLSTCLRSLASAVRPGGKFFVTFFDVPSGHSVEQEVAHQPGGIVTHFDRDPYHHRAPDVAGCGGHSWTARFIGDWGHPRAQKMMSFVRGP